MSRQSTALQRSLISQFDAQVLWRRRNNRIPLIYFYVVFWKLLSSKRANNLNVQCLSQTYTVQSQVNVVWRWSYLKMNRNGKRSEQIFISPFCSVERRGKPWPNKNALLFPSTKKCRNVSIWTTKCIIGKTLFSKLGNRMLLLMQQSWASKWSIVAGIPSWTDPDVTTAAWPVIGPVKYNSTQNCSPYPQQCHGSKYS